MDIHCLQSSLKPLLSKAAEEYLTDAAKPLYDLERPGDKVRLGGEAYTNVYLINAFLLLL